MPCILICRDKPGALETRLASRQAHLDYIEATGVVLYGGPMLDEAGDPCGSVLVLDTEDPEAARAWADRDPYAGAGLFESVVVRGFKVVVGG